MANKPSSVALSEPEKEEARDRKHPRAQVLYEAIRLEGQHELNRSAAALAWSSVAAGLSMGSSLVAMGLLRAALPEAPWVKLIVNLGYAVGFLIVIVARQQLFTENTLTPMIPLLHNKDRTTALRVLRLWAIVLAGNLLGTLAFAGALHAVFPADAQRAFAEIARTTMQGSFGSHFLRAIFSGWLIALMVWMLAGTDAHVFVIVVITYLIGLGDLSHIVAGSSEAFYAVFNGDASLAQALSEFLLPVGLGNMLGGVALVALLSHAQVAADEKR
ncbi:MAG TPA: formate/nitrite transporter family protein [Polyangiaceae bacterium]